MARESVVFSLSVLEHLWFSQSCWTYESYKDNRRRRIYCHYTKKFRGQMEGQSEPLQLQIDQPNLDAFDPQMKHKSINSKAE